MKLVLYDPAWPLYKPILEEALRTEWEIAAGASDDAWLGRQLPGADALLALKLPPEARACARRLRLLLFPGAGVMHADPQELPAGCALANVYEHEIPIAEYVMMAIFMHVTRVLDYSATFRRGAWDGNGRIGGEPHREAWGQTLGLIGYGHIGQTVADRARAFGMRVLSTSLESPLPLPDLLPQCDFLVIACPLTERSRGMLGASELALLPPHAMLINISRAEVVEEEALFQALRTGRLAAAALDVWYRYPAEPGGILHGSRFPFHQLPNVLVTPHLSAWTTGLLRRRMRGIAANLDHLARGEALERVLFTGTWKP